MVLHARAHVITAHCHAGISSCDVDIVHTQQGQYTRSASGLCVGTGKVFYQGSHAQNVARPRKLSQSYLLVKMIEINGFNRVARIRRRCGCRVRVYLREGVLEGRDGAVQGAR